MDDMKSFRNISDGIMKDIVVTPELKYKTLQKCKRRSYKPAIRVLVPAACVVLIVTAMAASGRFPWSSNTVPERSSEISIMMEAAPGGDKQPQDSAGDVLKAAQAGGQVDYKSPEEARGAFGENLLVPGYIPEGFRLKSIGGFPKEGQKADKVVFNYESGKVQLLITEEKIKVKNEFPGFRTVDINGVPGYVKTERIKTEDGTEQQRTELHWFGRDCRYSVGGQISEELAINIAKSMG